MSLIYFIMKKILFFIFALVLFVSCDSYTLEDDLLLRQQSETYANGDGEEVFSDAYYQELMVGRWRNKHIPDSHTIYMSDGSGYILNHIEQEFSWIIMNGRLIRTCENTDFFFFDAKIQKVDYDNVKLYYYEPHNGQWLDMVMYLERIH